MNKLNRSAGKADLIFICQECGLVAKHKIAGDCSNGCSRGIFRVARSNFPLIENPQKDPYRHKNTQEDGYDFKTPGGEASAFEPTPSIGESGLGMNERQGRKELEQEIKSNPDETVSTNANLPSDMDAFDITANPEPDNGQYGTPQSPALRDQGSDDNPNPLSQHRKQEPVGAFNMPHGPYNGVRDDNVYDRVYEKVHKKKGR